MNAKKRNPKKNVLPLVKPKKDSPKKAKFLNKTEKNEMKPIFLDLLLKIIIMSVIALNKIGI